MRVHVLAFLVLTTAVVSCGLETSGTAPATSTDGGSDDAPVAQGDGGGPPDGSGGGGPDAPADGPGADVALDAALDVARDVVAQDVVHDVVSEPTGVCTSGATQCAGNGVETCDATGKWGPPMDCGASNMTCVNGACAGMCAPGQTNPVPCGNCGTNKQTCGASGQWVDGTCDGQGCMPGSLQCAGGGNTQPQVCDSTCKWVNKGPQCGNNTQCSGGQCSCSATTGCLGCCSADNATCESGDLDTACGANGVTCYPCVGSACSPGGICM